MLTIKTNTTAAYGMSRPRIVGVNPTNGNPQILAFPNIAPAQVGTLVGSMFTVNGTPFSGKGFGYNPSSGKLDMLWDFMGNQYTNLATLPGPPPYPSSSLALLPFAAGNVIPTGAERGL